MVAHAFGPLALDELVSFTIPGNLRSRAVMERLGMTRSPDDSTIQGLAPATACVAMCSTDCRGLSSA